MRRRTLAALMAVLILGTAPSSAEPVSNAFTYQGSLARNGSPTTAVCNFRFSLFDQPSAGVQIGPLLLLDGVNVANGLFTVSLDFGPDQFAGDARWLQSAVQCAGDAGIINLSPRQPLSASPYALTLRPGAIISGDRDDAILRVANAGFGRGIQGTSVDGDGVYGESMNFNGVEGVGTSPDAIGVAGFNPDGRGVAGTSVTGRGVAASSTSGFGVHGQTSAADIATTCPQPFGNCSSGVYGTSSGSGGIGVVGVADLDDAIGVFGKSAGGTGIGVVGESAQHHGVEGIAHSMNAAGVHGVGDAGPGVMGESANGHGVVGSTDANSLAGVFGTSQNGPGVWGTGETVGVRGQSAGGSGVAGQSDSGTGVYASSGTGLGVWAQSNGFAMRADGDTKQALPSGGWVKAMVAVNPFFPAGQRIRRCFNSQASGATVSTVPCGFTLQTSGAGRWVVDFGFATTQRFAAVTVIGSAVGDPVVAMVDNPASNQVGVTLRQSEDAMLVDQDFVLFVY